MMDLELAFPGHSSPISALQDIREERHLPEQPSVQSFCLPFLKLACICSPVLADISIQGQTRTNLLVQWRFLHPHFS